MTVVRANIAPVSGRVTGSVLRMMYDVRKCVERVREGTRGEVRGLCCTVQASTQAVLRVREANHGDVAGLTVRQ